MDRMPLLAALLCAFVGCAAPPPVAPAPGRPAAEPWVPERAPRSWLLPADSVAALLAPDNLVVVHPRMSGPYPRDAVRVRFAEESTPAERREAVRSVGGRVVGGDLVYHYLLVHLPCADAPVWCAVDRLSAAAGVVEAAPLVMGFEALRAHPPE
jgi:hypothetical protein